MRVNIIASVVNHPNYKQDVLLLKSCIVAANPDNVVNILEFGKTVAKEADLNLFLGVIDPAMFPTARKNIFISIRSTLPESWNSFIPLFDDVWVRSPEAQPLYQSLNPKSITNFSPWTSFPTEEGKNTPNRFKHILTFMDTPLTAEHWNETMPKLHIVSPSATEEVHTGNITVYPFKTDTKRLFSYCGIFLNVESTQFDYQHTVRQAMSAGQVIMNVKEPSQIPHTLNEIYSSDLLKQSELNINQYKENHTEFMNHILTYLNAEATQPAYVMYPEIKTDELPYVSVITPTRNRRYFLQLAKYCFLMQNYPREKLEWIILDDSDYEAGDKIAELLHDSSENVRYIYKPYEPHHTVGWKRNELIKAATHPYIVHMDDDDYYPANSILYRITQLLRYNKTVAASLSVPSYHISEFTSYIRTNGSIAPLEQRVFEATMAYHKSVAIKTPFDEFVQYHEATPWFQQPADLSKTLFLDSKEIIVNLLHKGTLRSSAIPPGVPLKNGSCYGWPNELFMLITDIGADMDNMSIENKNDV